MSRIRKKRFQCGHRGFGKHCHRCSNDVKTTRRSAHATEGQQGNPARRSRIPRRIAAKARKIEQALSSGASWQDFRGKRLRCDRALISIPVTRRYRLVACEHSGGVRVIACLSHAEYNKIGKGYGR